MEYDLIIPLSHNSQFIMKKFAQKYKKHLLFAVLGATLGFAYWRFVGCTSGTCPLTSNWHTSVLFGSLIGFLAVPDRKNKTEDISKRDSDTHTHTHTHTDNNSKQ